MIQINAKTNTQITSLNLSNRGLIEIPKEVFFCTNLKKLNLSNNGLSKIPKDIDKLNKLEVLDLSNNKLKLLQAGLFNLKRLKILILSHNQLKTIPKQILKLKYLKILMIQNNNIEYIDSEILPKTIEKLNISKNKLKNLKWLKNITNLESIWINDNPVEDFSLELVLEQQLKNIYAFSTIELPSKTNTEYLVLSRIKGNAIKSSKLSNYSFYVESEEMVQTTTEEKSPHIFISYAHSNKDWLNRVIIHLEGLKNLNLNFDIWEDTRIKTGDEWLKSIQESMDKANIAILLISADFIASQFVMRKEVPHLLEKAEKNGAVILPIILSPCLFTDTNIGKYQAVNAPEKTLEDCTYAEQERTLTKLMQEIKEIINT